MSTQLTIEMRVPRPPIATQAHAREKFAGAYAPLLLILALQVAEAALLLHNTAFQDEALYIYAGTQLVHALNGGPPPSENYAVEFSGYPYVYPLLAGALNIVGGLEAVRWFSTLCMLVPTTCVYTITRRLFTRASGLAAAGLFAFLGPTLFLSRLATFDALCLALLAVATAIAFQVSAARDPAGAVALGPLFLLAVGAKYVAILFVPLIIGLMAVRTIELRGWWRMVGHVALTLVSTAVLGAALFHVMNHDFLAAVTVTTTQRTALIRAPISALMDTILSLGGPMWLLGLFGLLLSRKRVRLTALGLVVTSLAAPAYHLYAGELVSLHKHVGFGLFFIAPLAGHAVAEMSSRVGVTRLDLRWFASLMVFLAMFIMGIAGSSWWYHSWPNSSQLVMAMRTQVRPSTGRYLCEDVEVVRYYLADVTSPYEYTGPDFFQYTDKHGNHLMGDAAYKAAIADGYFDIVEVSFVHTSLDKDLEAALQANRQYQLIAKIPYTNSYGSSYYFIWRKQVT